MALHKQRFSINDGGKDIAFLNNTQSGAINAALLTF